MKRFNSAIFLLIAGLMLGGCASTGTNMHPAICAVLGAAVGGGAVAAIDDDHDPAVAGGAAVGATVGYLLCHRAPQDSDGDGVTDDLDQCPGTPAGVEVEANGCPKVGETLMTLEGVNFDFDSDQLTYESQAKLDEAATTLNANSLVNVQVVGHTDSRGSESYNQGLSERRAAAVVDYLTNNGVSGSRLSSAGMGESQPVADNSTEDGRYQNRRVELVVVE